MSIADSVRCACMLLIVDIPKLYIFPTWSIQSFHSGTNNDWRQYKDEMR